MITNTGLYIKITSKKTKLGYQGGIKTYERDILLWKEFSKIDRLTRKDAFTDADDMMIQEYHKANEKIKDNVCDICGLESKSVLPGRWIFYCPAHKQNDINKTIEKEVYPALESGDMSDLINNGELADLAMNIL